MRGDISGKVWELSNMPTVAYRPIKDAPVKGTVSKAVIQKAVDRLAELRKRDPKGYRALIKESSRKPVRLAVP
jgi:hypothetical protein